MFILSFKRKLAFSINEFVDVRYIHRYFDV